MIIYYNVVCWKRLIVPLWATRLRGRNIKVWKHLGEMSTKNSGQNKKKNLSFVTSQENGFQVDWTTVKGISFFLS